ncbi:MAG: hypothetical protein AAB772_02345 [Patescibacteria group bacterium]
MEEDKKDKFPFVEFLLWFLGAGVADLISLIPYLGALVSIPFGLAFLLYKTMKGINMKKALLTSGLDVAVEAIFSTLPANLADVIITYAWTRGEGALAKTGAVTGKIAKKT